MAKADGPPQGGGASPDHLKEVEVHALMIPSQQHLEKCLHHWGLWAGQADTQA